MNRMAETALDRFWAKIDKKGPDDCWEWTASLNSGGYGKFTVTNTPHRIVRAHRYAWELKHGAVPDGFVCHSCDNKLCCNPAHLWVGEPADNTRDMMAKGRASWQKITHCPHGHEYTPENTYFGKGGRYCKTCNREAARRISEKKKARRRELKIISLVGPATH